MSDAPELSAILPAYNEEKNLGQTLAHLMAFLDETVPFHEVLVVDDGSRDGTAQVVRAWSRRNSRVRLLSHARNRGYGAALKSGFEAARGRLIFFMDADGQFDARDLGWFLPLMDRWDGVLGYRVNRQDSVLRRINAFGWNTLTRNLLGIPYRDIDCAFKLYHRRVLEALPIASEGALINAEMLARIQARGFRLTEVGVRHYPRRAGQATGARPDVVLRAFGELFSLYGSLRQETRLAGRGAEEP